VLTVNFRQPKVKAVPVTITNPGDTKSVAFSGTPPATPANGTMDTSTVGMSYQIDGNLPISFPINPPTGMWDVPVLTEGDCPTATTWYTLTVYAFDKDGNMGVAQSTFQRSS
jgi:hypothetical protein